MLLASTRHQGAVWCWGAGQSWGLQDVFGLKEVEMRLQQWWTDTSIGNFCHFLLDVKASNLTKTTVTCPGPIVDEPGK